MARAKTAVSFYHLEQNELTKVLTGSERLAAVKMLSYAKDKGVHYILFMCRSYTFTAHPDCIHVPQSTVFPSVLWYDLYTGHVNQAQFVCRNVGCKKACQMTWISGQNKMRIIERLATTYFQPSESVADLDAKTIIVDANTAPRALDLLPELRQYAVAHPKVLTFKDNDKDDFAQWALLCAHLSVDVKSLESKPPRSSPLVHCGDAVMCKAPPSNAKLRKQNPKKTRPTQTQTRPWTQPMSAPHLPVSAKVVPSFDPSRFDDHLASILARGLPAECAYNTAWIKVENRWPGIPAYSKNAVPSAMARQRQPQQDKKKPIDVVAAPPSAANPQPTTNVVHLLQQVAAAAAARPDNVRSTSASLCNTNDCVNTRAAACKNQKCDLHCDRSGCDDTNHPSHLHADELEV